MTAADLVDRLEGARRVAADRWTARCPAHEDRSPSLSIRELTDGTILLHCFAGCAALDIVHALGLSLADLFPNKPEHHREPSRRRISASDALVGLDHEVTVVWLIGTWLIDRREIREDDWKRLTVAVARIGQTRAVCGSLKLAR